MTTGPMALPLTNPGPAAVSTSTGTGFGTTSLVITVVISVLSSTVIAVATLECRTGKSYVFWFAGVSISNDTPMVFARPISTLEIFNQMTSFLTRGGKFLATETTTSFLFLPTTDS